MAPPPVPLSSLLREARRSPRRPVALAPDGVLRAGALAEAVRNLAARLAEHEPARWLVAAEDARAAAVALLALAHSGGVAVLAPSARPEALRRHGPGCVGVLSDGALGLPGLPLLHPLEQPAAEPARWSEPSPDAPLVELCTSGTTGDAVPVQKRLRHLDGEVAVLEALFGERLGPDATLYATVAQQHVYGLLFRLWWPLASGRSFWAGTPLHAEELLPRLAEARACALVTTPVHLERLVASGRLASLGGRCRAIFTSAGPLAADTAARVREELGVAPFEILGSTETGGVAWRQRSRHGESWKAFPGVALATGEDERLWVSSPYVSSGEGDGAGRERFLMGDRAKLEGPGRFQLFPRADRTVKIGGKRLSLPAMEAELTRHPWVAEAALVALPRGSQLRVHAALVPSEAGRQALRGAGRRALARELGEHLGRSFDPVLLPRAWRALPALPRNRQGKLPSTALAALFARRDPEFARSASGAGRLRWEGRVPEDLAFLEGHFEGLPLVPGVAQLRWALEAAGELLGAAPRLAALEALKFPTPLRPAQAIALEVELDVPRGRLRFRLCARDDESRVFASGRCLLAGEGA